MEAAITVDEKIRAFPERCRTAGLKVTQQRREVYGLLACSSSHMCPEDIYQKISATLPSLSRATVYKILDQFHRHGILHKVPSRNQVARYDARTDIHHHLICTRCDRIEDVVLPPLPGNLIQAPAEAGFRTESSELIIHGICRECEAQQAP